jgi:hypothetical protein
VYLNAILSQFNKEMNAFHVTVPAKLVQSTHLLALHVNKDLVDSKDRALPNVHQDMQVSMENALKTV